MLLAENRFRDSKAFYEEIKPRIRAEVLAPLWALAEDVEPAVHAIDPQIVVSPHSNGCISRIRRDNRYTRDKSMYRENVWIGLMRDKKAWPFAPGFYVDFSIQGGSYGMGFYYVPPRLMQILRRQIDNQPQKFLRAAQQAADAGFQVTGDRYARPKKEGLPPLLDELYNRKCLSFEHCEAGPAFFGTAALAQTLQQAYGQLAPLYRLLLQAAETELEERGKEA